ncbi:uncharacterized protein TNCV_1849421 [Trichonephila clavipes]|nr:uncharacterized protein TNCV_1849421 [Trichonephila clavipes]
MLIYELPASSLKCRAQPNVIRRSFEPHDQILYHRTILEPHTAYPIPAGTNYIVLTVQKTAFGLDIIPESLLPQLIQKGFHVGDFRKMKKFDQTPYKLPPPTPIHVPAEKRPLEEKSLLSPRNNPKTCADSTITCADSSVSCLRATCADSSVSSSTVTCADSSVTSPTVTCADSSVTCADSSVTSPTVTCADSSVTCPTATYADSTCPRTPCSDSTCIRTYANSSVTSPTVTCADSTCPRTTCAVLHVSEPMQIPVSQVPQSPVQSLPEPCRVSQNSTFCTLWSRQMHSTSSCHLYLDPKNSRCFTRYPLFLMVISSHSWMNLKGRLWT